MPDSADIAVVGGGILGSALAYHLVERTPLRVVLYDGGAERASTPRAAGILTTVGWDTWDLALVRYSAAEIEGLSRAEGLGEFRRDGALRLSRSAEGAAWLDRVRDLLVREGIAARSVDAREAATIAPAPDLEDLRAGLYTPDDATFDAAEVAAAYRTLAARRGCEIRHGRPATVSQGESGWVVVSPDFSVRAERIVLAAGAWTKGLLGRLGVDLPIAPFRSQAAELRPHPLAHSFPALHDLDQELYLRPGTNGRVIAGDGTEREESDPTSASSDADAPLLERLQAGVRGLFPSWDALTVERDWAGLCVATIDRYPIVGPIPSLPGLAVATGFNGLGAMRAPGIARCVAEALRTGDWAPLGPAAPARFLPASRLTEVRPEFPLEADPSTWGAVAPSARFEPAELEAHTAHSFHVHPVRSLAEMEGLELPPLSEWFDALLPQFLGDALRTGGEVSLAVSSEGIVGVYLYTPAEGVGSVFTRRRAVALAFLPGSRPGGVYADRPWLDGGEPIEIMAADLRDWAPRYRYRNPVRVAGPSDLTGVQGLMEELTGSTDRSWFGTLPRREEVGFLAEVDGRLVGMSWATVVGAHARGHSFMVHPRYQGLGIGTDLLQARMAWLRGLGVRQVVSEIYEGNAASKLAAERAGMASVARMYHYRPPTAEAGAKGRGGAMSSGPRTSGSWSPSSP